MNRMNELIDLAKPAAVADTLGRPLRDLRISVTDRCNLRCTYCMPREVFGKDFVFLPRAELLSFEEIERVARRFLLLGVHKIRLSGGEPLMRHGVEKLIEKLARLTCVDGQPVEIAMTTNGVLLAKKAQTLKDAGLTRLTVSLDGLSEATFRRMSDSDVPVNHVLDGIAAAAANADHLDLRTLVEFFNFNHVDGHVGSPVALCKWSPPSGENSVFCPVFGSRWAGR